MSLLYETKRLDAVDRLRMMGTPAEERFDKITRLARRVFNVPVSLIDIVGEDRIWLKSAQGLDLMEAERALAYCQNAVLRDNICFVPDARIDPRFEETEEVLEGFVFYAGVPLRYEGESVGVFCICDSKPRDMTPEEFDSLRDLASLAEHELQVAALSENQLVLAAANEELAERALIDTLTRIWNRGAISEIAARELETARTNGEPTAFILLDIDHFKKVNDTYGHVAGDEVLRKVGEKLRQVVRPLDAVGRWGGEEFLCVLPGCGESDLFLAAERIREAIAKTPIRYEGHLIPVTASLGATLSRDGSHFVELLVRAADQGLYKAKLSGRNKTCIRHISQSFLTMPVPKR